MAFESVDCGKLWRFSGSGPEIKLGLFWIEAWSISAWANERWLVSIYILNCCAGLLFSTLICEQALVDDQSPKLFTVNYHTWVDMFGISNVLSSSIFCQFLVSIITYTKYTQFKVHTFWKCLLQFSIILKLWLVVVWLFWICKSITANRGLLHVSHQITAHRHAVCHMTGSWPFPMWVLHIVQYSASSFNF